LAFEELPVDLGGGEGQRGKGEDKSSSRHSVDVEALKTREDEGTSFLLVR